MAQSQALRRYAPYIWIVAALVATAAAFSLAGVVHDMSLLPGLSTFDHGRCDALLQHRKIEITSNVYQPSRGPGHRNRAYETLYIITAWLSGVIVFLFGSWGLSRRWGETQTALFFFFIFGCGMLLSHLEAMADYVSICEQLLRNSAASVPNTASQLPSPLSLLLGFGGFFGAFITILRARLKGRTALWPSNKN